MVKLDARNGCREVHEGMVRSDVVRRSRPTRLAQSLELAGSIAAEHGALTLSVYSTDDAVLDAAHEAAIRGGVALSINLTGGVFVNQSAAFSDFHGTGANPAANAALTDAAFVANRFASSKAAFMLNRKRPQR